MSWPPSPERIAPLSPWFDRVRRDLPWRAANLDAPHPDPYAVLVSELMLQQTQVATVKPYFTRWMARFPDLEGLAAAPPDAVHKAWEGLGYYRRARHLHAAASILAREGWPMDLAGLQALPGLGPYTAAAVGAIAFQWPTPALDGNAFRVLARLLGLDDDPRRQAGPLRDWLKPALVTLGPSRITQALMELGATHCGPRPDCGGCPLARGCEARQTGRTAELPPPRTRAQPRTVDLWLLAVVADDQLLLLPPAERGLLAGLWRFPSVEGPSEGLPVARLGSAELLGWPGWTQVYTHRREVVRPLRLQVARAFPLPPEFAWIGREALERLPLGRRDARLRALLDSPCTPAPEAPGASALMRACGVPWA